VAESTTFGGSGAPARNVTHRPRGIVIFDERGEIFTKIHQLDLGLALWRVSDPRDLERNDQVDLGVIALYEDTPQDVVRIADEHRFGLLVLAERYDAGEADKAIDLGLLGFLGSDIEPAALRRAILGILAGEPGFTRAIIGGWLRRQRTCFTARRGVAALTDRQRQVLVLMRQGLADKEIGERLGIATATAQKHVTNILDRLSVTNRAAAAAATCSLLLRDETAQPTDDIATARVPLFSVRPDPRTA
jgi:DNA-binding NarL/FixJ family response regulator